MSFRSVARKITKRTRVNSLAVLAGGLMALTAVVHSPDADAGDLAGQRRAAEDQIAEARAEITKGRSAYLAGLDLYNARRTQYNEARDQLNEGRATANHLLSDAQQAAAAAQRVYNENRLAAARALREHQLEQAARYSAIADIAHTQYGTYSHSVTEIRAALADIAVKTQRLRAEGVRLSEAREELRRARERLNEAVRELNEGIKRFNKELKDAQNKQIVTTASGVVLDLLSRIVARDVNQALFGKGGDAGSDYPCTDSPNFWKTIKFLLVVSQVLEENQVGHQLNMLGDNRLRGLKKLVHALESDPDHEVVGVGDVTACRTVDLNGALTSHDFDTFLTQFEPDPVKRAEIRRVAEVMDLLNLVNSTKVFTGEAAPDLGVFPSDKAGELPHDVKQRFEELKQKEQNQQMHDLVTDALTKANGTTGQFDLSLTPDMTFKDTIAVGGHGASKVLSKTKYTKTVTEVHRNANWCVTMKLAKQKCQLIIK